MRSLLLILGVLLMSAPTFAQVEFTELTLDNNCIGASGLYACDLDDDGDLDIIAAENEGNRTTWYRNDGGTPIQWSKFNVRNGMLAAHSVHANDIDNDGDLDILSTTYGSSIYWFSNDGGDPITWGMNTVATGFTQAHEVYSADIDGDGDFDVLGAASGLNRINVWYNEGGDPITWTEQIVDASCMMAKSVHAADVNGDGFIDIISAGLQDSDVMWYENDGGSPVTWTTHTVDANFYSAHRVQGIDMDGDGDTDILGAAYLGNMVSWWKNDGQNPPSWSEQLIVTGFEDACIAQAADIDGDGILDVVATAQGDDRVAWFQSDGGDPITWTAHDLTTSFDRPWPLYVCDIDDDGDNDILSASSYNSVDQLKLWRNEGDGAFVVESTLFPSVFALDVYPNPFNSWATVRIQLNQPRLVRLTLISVTGQEVATVADRYMAAGIHTVTMNSNELAAGVYFLRLRGDPDHSWTRKVVVLK